MESALHSSVQAGGAPGAAARKARRPREDDEAFLARLDAFQRTGARELPPADARRLAALAVTLARGRSADDLRIGEGLAALRQHDLKLGYNGIGDLAREELGIDPPHARWLAGMAEKLATRPKLRAAVLSGDVSLRKADAVVDVAFGEREAYWVERAKLDTVKSLEVAAKGSATPDEEDWREVILRVDPDMKEHVEFAFEIASVLLDDLDAPKWRLIEAIAMEYLGEFPPEKSMEPPPAPPPLGRRNPEAIAAARVVVERARQAAQASQAARDADAVTPAEPQAIPEPTLPAPTPIWPRPKPGKLLRELKALVQARIPDDERLGKVCLLVRQFHAWKAVGARSFEFFCVEHLGLAPSTVRQRMKLEVWLRKLPPLREALRSGQLSYEQARAVARVATPADVEQRIEEAAAKPCIDTKREVQEEVDRQAWREGKVETRVSPQVNELLADAIAAARLRTGLPLTPGQALFFMGLHFQDTWEEQAIRLVKAADPVKKRDRCRCQVPGCSSRATHVHHVRFRSRGGTDDAWNLVSVCTAHHLAGIHQGYIVVTGTATDGLVWEFPGREGLEEEEVFLAEPAAEREAA